MKVLIAVPYFWPQVGGMENYARFLTRGLAEVGCEVVAHVVGADPDHHGAQAAQLLGREVVAG